MDKIPSQLKNPKGLHQRYFIQKIVPSGMFDDTDSRLKLAPCDEGSEYFVMRLDEGGKDREHIKACRIGIHAYANVVQHHLPELAKELKERYPLLDETESQSSALQNGDIGYTETDLRKVAEHFMAVGNWLLQQGSTRKKSFEKEFSKFLKSKANNPLPNQEELWNEVGNLFFDAKQALDNGDFETFNKIKENIKSKYSVSPR